MKPEIKALQELMKQKNLDWYIVPTTDFHGSEYVNPHFRCRAFLSGFTGSAGTLLVGRTAAYLWTDGRYFLQAESQLTGTGITLMKMGEPEVPTLLEFLKKQRESGSYTLGFDGRVVSAAQGREYEKLDVSIAWEEDLADRIWADRPPVKPSAIHQLPLSVTGQSTEEKIQAVQRAMKEANRDFLLLTSLEEIAWLTNLRGDDIQHTPVFFAFALVPCEGNLELFAYEDVMPQVASLLPAGINLHPYGEVTKTVQQVPADSTLWMNGNQANYELYKMLPAGIEVLNGPSPIDLMKAIKNETEIAGEKVAQHRDGLAMVEFLYWLDQKMAAQTSLQNSEAPMSQRDGAQPQDAGQREDSPEVALEQPQEPGQQLTEIAASDYLEQCRRNHGAYDLSFDTISGYNENGAIVHYTATEETNADLAPNGFLLVDSGGQYPEGTTDITRTIALGPLTQKMKQCYTAVLKGHIALADARFPAGTDGLALDTLTRKPIHALGLDYNHGTGHGVGHLLSVHEGPNTISKRGATQEILPGMITSDEPGVYLAGEFGIRLENLTLCVDLGDGTYGFEPMTLCPFDRRAILIEDLTENELQWLNHYHARVYEELAPDLAPALATWLAEATAPLSR